MSHQMSVSETIVPTLQPQEMLNAFVTHLRDDHGIEFSVADDGTHFIDQDVFRIEFGVQTEGLRVRLAGPNDNALVFFKEEIVHHVADVDAPAAEAMRWTEDPEGLQKGTLPPNFHIMTVLKSWELFEGMQRITVYCPGVAMQADAGIHLRMLLPLETGRTPVWPRMGANGSPVWPQGDNKLHARFVTIRHSRPEAGEIDIDIVRHGSGLISQFAQNAAPGQVAGAMGPAGMERLPPQKRYFLAADGTGLPALARLLETLPDTAQGDVIVALPEGVDYLPDTSLSVHTLPPRTFEADVVAKTKLLTAQSPIGYGFFAGEFENAQAIRAHFKKTLGLDKTNQVSTAYWRRDTPGFGS